MDQVSEISHLMTIDNTIYKVKMLYPSDHRKFIFGNEIETVVCKNIFISKPCMEAVLRSIIYANENGVHIGDIETANFIIKHEVKFWKTSEKLGFKRAHKILKTSQYLYILTIKVKEDILHDIENRNEPKESEIYKSIRSRESQKVEKVDMIKVPSYNDYNENQDCTPILSCKRRRRVILGQLSVYSKPRHQSDKVRHEDKCYQSLEQSRKLCVEMDKQTDNSTCSKSENKGNPITSKDCEKNDRTSDLMKTSKDVIESNAKSSSKKTMCIRNLQQGKRKSSGERCSNEITNCPSHSKFSEHQFDMETKFISSLKKTLDVDDSQNIIRSRELSGNNRSKKTSVLPSIESGRLGQMKTPLTQTTMADEYVRNQDRYAIQDEEINEDFKLQQLVRSSIPKEQAMPPTRASIMQKLLNIFSPLKFLMSNKNNTTEK